MAAGRTGRDGTGREGRGREGAGGGGGRSAAALCEARPATGRVRAGAGGRGAGHGWGAAPRAEGVSGRDVLLRLFPEERAMSAFPKLPRAGVLSGCQKCHFL